MEKELLILNHLVNNAHVPQREIAKSTGLGLGTVNLLLKKMAKKGLLKMEQVNKRSLRYILTPRGIAEKSRLAYQFTVESYTHINKVYQAVQELLNDVRAGNNPALTYPGPAPDPVSAPASAVDAVPAPGAAPVSPPATSAPTLRSRLPLPPLPPSTIPGKKPGKPPTPRATVSAVRQKLPPPVTPAGKSGCSARWMNSGKSWPLSCPGKGLLTALPQT